ncbi:MAG: hypothetical protein QG656_1963, partial [Candidatus Hydrogenedentes bacterium]|nr:hypothetical protein [Candidatus Hydrogenedentota bacterium]
AAEKSLSSICSRGGADSLPAVLDAMNGAALEPRLALMRVAARVGGPVALERVLASMADADAAVSGEAVRAISDWPTLDAVPHLLELAKSADLNRQVLGLRGYVRLARIEPSPEAKAGMLTTAMGLAARPDEKKLVVAAWGTLPSAQALDVLQPLLDDADLRNEAASALITVAPEAAKIDEASKTRAQNAIAAVLEKFPEGDIHQSAHKARGGIK